MSKTGIELIVEERKRQIEEENWSLEYDTMHKHGQLAIRAAELAVHHTDVRVDLDWEESDIWGLVSKHQHNEKKCLVIAGALIAAELDRIISRED